MCVFCAHTVYWNIIFYDYHGNSFVAFTCIPDGNYISVFIYYEKQMYAKLAVT